MSTHGASEEPIVTNTESETKSGEGMPYYGARNNKQSDGKRLVAEFVVKELIKEGDSILLDAGSSLTPVAEMICNQAKATPGQTHYTIITHNDPAFQILREVPSAAMVNVVLAGGRYDRDLQAMFGPQTQMAYDNFFPRVVLIGISGIVADQGLFCHGNTEELAVKEVIFRKPARDRVIIADYSKLGLQDSLRFGTSDHLHANVEECVLVTNQPPQDADVRVRDRFEREVDRLKSYNVKVVIVPR